MHIPDKYRKMYDNLALSHPWMREMRDADDIPDDELVRELRYYADDVRYDYNPLDDAFEPDERLSALCGQVADMLERRADAPEGDAVAMLRKYVEERESANGKAGTRGKLLLQIADMVERDYVKREVHDEAIRLKLIDIGVQRARCRELEAERDEALEIRDKALGDAATFKYERDELKTMNEKLQVALDAVEGCDERCKRLEAERDELKRKEKQLGNELGLRDKAIELLQDVKQELTAERDELKARISELEKQWDARDSDCIALEAKVNRLEDEITDWSELYTQVFNERDHVIAERDEWKTKCETCEVAYKQADAERKMYSEQIDELFAERDEWRVKFTAAIGAIEEPSGWRDENRELYLKVDRLEAERDEWRARAESMLESCSTCSRFCGIDAHSKPHSTTEPSLSQLFGILSDANDDSAPESVVTPEAVDANDVNDALDSREKLEADVFNHVAISITPNKDDDGVLAPYATVRGWLDCQASITRRELQGQVDRLKRENAALARDLAESESLRRAAEAEVIAAKAAKDYWRGLCDQKAERDE